jgi:cytosine/adenosine deaminase-related metal-dependent hydrolase
MLEPPASISYRARWVIPIDGPPIAHGVVTIASGKIAVVGKSCSEGEVIDLGNVALLPALVNAHTHLEFSLFEEPFGQRGNSFAAWLKDVVTWRREQPAVQGQLEMALAQGLRETQQAATTMLGEIATPPFSDCWSLQPWESPHSVFMELLSLNPDREPILGAMADEYTRETASPFRRGLSPHTPYTVHPRLLERAVQLSKERKFPLEMHVAESREELELLANQTGPLVDLLKSLAAWYPQSLSRGLKPLDYLQSLAKAHRAVIAHGNYLSAEDIAFVAEHRAKLSVAYCPRTQAYFDHDPYPLEAMLKAGVRVAIGTDSRGSNPDLSVWNELKFVRERYPTLAPSEILRMGTLAGAEALGVAEEYGSIAPGKVAALASIQLPTNPIDPMEAVLSGISPPTIELPR